MSETATISTNPFPHFDRFACHGDRVKAKVDGFTVTATLYHDEDRGAPDEDDEGFWPSKDPEAAGWVLPENFDDQMAKATEAMRAWKNDEWHYVGVAVIVSKAGVQLTGRYDHACWGFECNHPSGDNTHLAEAADDLLGDALDAARAKLALLCTCTESAS